ncbi:MAG: hypothetical protein R2729_28215 [Bryobacteraceae bacterium]
MIAKLQGLEYCSRSHMVTHHEELTRFALSEPYYGRRRTLTRVQQPQPEGSGTARRALLATSIGLGLGMLAQPDWLFPRKKFAPAARTGVAAEPSFAERMTQRIRPMRQSYDLSAQVQPEGWTTTAGASLWEVENNWLRPTETGLFTPSAGMEDGFMSYLVQIVRGGAGFLMRAQDLGNHYAVRVRSGGAPGDPMILQAVVVRNGVERVTAQERISETTTWFRTVHNVAVRMDGDFFTARLNGTIVGTWRDRTFPRGAIGVQVAETDDFRVYQGRVEPA